MLIGAVPVKLSGRIGSGDRESRFNVEADLTTAKLENLLPGWVKPAGKPARAMFLMTKDKNAIRFDDLLVDGPGVLAKGTAELDANGELVAANFPVFATSDGDKASVKASRGADGALKVEMRGDVYDGRNFIKTALAGPNDCHVDPSILRGEVCSGRQLGGTATVGEPRQLVRGCSLQGPQRCQSVITPVNTS